MALPRVQPRHAHTGTETTDANPEATATELVEGDGSEETTDGAEVEVPEAEEPAETEDEGATN